MTRTDWAQIAGLYRLLLRINPSPVIELNRAVAIAMDLHDWFISTRSWRQMHGKKGGAGGIDDDFAVRGTKNIGAWILGRNMFGPVRGPWPDMNWKGWWGDNPPYHVPVYVLTHHSRPPLEMDGGTTFYFVTEGIQDALAKAGKAANGKDIGIRGGVNTIQQYLREGLIDELHIAITPTILGGGERLFDGVDLRRSGYECVRFDLTALLPRRKNR